MALNNSNTIPEIFIPVTSELEVRQALGYNADHMLTVQDYYEYGYVRGYNNCVQNDSFASDTSMGPLLTLQDLEEEDGNEGPSSLTDSEVSSIMSEESPLNTGFIEFMGGKMNRRTRKKKGGMLSLNTDDINVSARKKTYPWKKLALKEGSEIKNKVQKKHILQKMFPWYGELQDFVGEDIDNLLVVKQKLPEDMQKRIGMKEAVIYNVYDIDRCNKEYDICDPVTLKPIIVSNRLNETNPFSRRKSVVPFSRRKSVIPKLILSSLDLKNDEKYRNVTPDSVAGIEELTFSPILRKGERKTRRKRRK
jgi:hypothetical protein